jgi:hypothetical protein
MNPISPSNDKNALRPTGSRKHGSSQAKFAHNAGEAFGYLHYADDVT